MCVCVFFFFPSPFLDWTPVFLKGDRLVGIFTLRCLCGTVRFFYMGKGDRNVEPFVYLTLFLRYLSPKREFAVLKGLHFFLHELWLREGVVLGSIVARFLC